MLLVAVATLSLSSRQNPPPTIAEFAPQAVERITDADRALGSGSGAGAQETPPPELDPVTGLPRDAAAVDVARVRQCVGDPPRQIEDPQSPPCVPFWSGDNGGATWHGVSRDEIRVVATQADVNGGWAPAMQAFFNKRFEFYGRKIRLIQPTTRENFTPEGDRAAARSAYEQDQAFAASKSDSATFNDELARVGVIASGLYTFFPETHMATRHPYLWSYQMANDRMFAMAGDWYCARFAGRNAVHAADPFLRASLRKPGILFGYFPGAQGTSPEPMQTELSSCGGRAELAEVSGLDAASAENAVLQMKTTGVTTIACLCHVPSFGLAMHAANNQAYFPEWLVTPYISLDINAYIKLYQMPASQSSQLMGLTMQPMQRPPADHPSNWAMQEATGTQPEQVSLYQAGFDDQYRAMLLLASGIQMAGPNLRPATFAEGLRRTRFPNPRHRIMAGDVGFNDGDHSMTDDAAEMWWSNSARSPYADEGVGAFCHVDRGARRRMGAFPAGDEVFFNGDCDSGVG